MHLLNYEPITLKNEDGKTYVYSLTYVSPKSDNFVFNFIKEEQKTGNMETLLIHIDTLSELDFIYSDIEKYWEFFWNIYHHRTLVEYMTNNKIFPSINMHRMLKECPSSLNTVDEYPRGKDVTCYRVCIFIEDGSIYSKHNIQKAEKMFIAYSEKTKEAEIEETEIEDDTVEETEPSLPPFNYRCKCGHLKIFDIRFLVENGLRVPKCEICHTTCNIEI